ncbi:4Fe-4S dicluster domain-containing protein [Clostridium aminobutyricum]|uniref:4Fe-4S dicluster domain-containing protein n=1 Tax=Clostridium aminobutyricum TaxID=33953 RepID=A0A939IGK4_CLOAM|nr:4Fe-4S dicluster domain-containing protein [Clostridium aminobutyricum]MBN7773455.1 4Fe-4S dicluster domain-containing protein [Clostridium aminobutyricum]
MRIFDTKVQEIKYKVLSEVARKTWEGKDSFAEFDDIAKLIVADEPTMRCCIYKERAIVAERIRIALGGKKDNPNIIEVIEIACDECPVAGHVVTDLCRGCIAHRCQDVCKLGAISFDEHQNAKIDKSKCVECGKCANVCPYKAINNFIRPCERACKVKAIHMGETKAATIDHSKCISCGACVYQCPFGATVDKSFIVDAIHIIKGSKENTAYKVYAIVAPSIASQFKYVEMGQVITGIKNLGFFEVMEVAFGADMVALSEAQELIDKGFLTTSCCPAFVSYIYKHCPSMIPHISHNLSPMAALGKYIKEHDRSAKVIFIGPCTAKKEEIRREEVGTYVDCVLTFEELQALFSSRDIELECLEEKQFEKASGFGRGFANTGGVAQAVTQAVKELATESGEESTAAHFTVNPIACDGIEKCKTILLRASKGGLPNNLIEGMACIDGCIGGAGCLSHGEKNRDYIVKYSNASKIKSLHESGRAE